MSAWVRALEAEVEAENNFQPIDAPFNVSIDPQVIETRSPSGSRYVAGRQYQHFQPPRYPWSIAVEEAAWVRIREQSVLLNTEPMFEVRSNDVACETDPNTDFEEFVSLPVKTNHRFPTNFSHVGIRNAHCQQEPAIPINDFHMFPTLRTETKTNSTRAAHSCIGRSKSDGRVKFFQLDYINLFSFLRT